MPAALTGMREVTVQVYDRQFRVRFNEKGWFDLYEWDRHAQRYKPRLHRNNHKRPEHGVYHDALRQAELIVECG